MKKLLPGIAIVLLVGAAAWYFSSAQQTFAKDIELVTYTTPGAETTLGTLYIPFVKEAKGRITAWIDINGDGTYADTERVVTNMPVSGRTNWRSGFGVRIVGAVSEGAKVKVAIDSGDVIETVLKMTSVGGEDVLELDKVTDAENAMKGFGINVAHAEDPVTSAFRPGVPDLGQRIAECAPTAAVNSIMSLAEENGKSLSDLPTPTEMVDQLKGEMDWTPANGVLPDDFVEGKTRWAVTHGLPIITEKVGDQHGLKTLQELLDAMGSEDGAAAELRIKFAQNGKVKGGHMVTVVGVHINGDEVYIDVNDPKTPAGTETYRVEGNVIQEYPYEGDAVISWGFVQRWQEPTGTALDPMTDAEIQGIRDAVGATETIKVIVVDGKNIPVSQVHIGQGPECKKGDKEMPHWHANVGDKATAIDGTVMRDPGGCGFGMAINVPVIDVQK